MTIKVVPTELVVGVNSVGDALIFDAGGYAVQAETDIGLYELIDELPTWKDKYTPGVWKFVGNATLYYAGEETSTYVEKVEWEGEFTQLWIYQ